MKICVYMDMHPKAKYISQSMYNGARVLGLDVEITHERHSSPRGDLLVAYGWKNQDMFEAYRAAGSHYLYIDLAYWGRKNYLNSYDGYFKVVLDARHPTRYMGRGGRTGDRSSLAPKIQPWIENGDHIVVAGMSAKAAESVGLRPLEWERSTINKIWKMSDLPITYRPKPTRGCIYSLHTIPDTTFSSRLQSVYDVLDRAYMLVTYHSNIAVQALAYGVPVCVEEGPCLPMGGSLVKIKKPDNREQFICNLSYCQFTREEMNNGYVYRQFMEDGLLG